MPVDNTIYDRDADGWWEGDNHLVLLRGMIDARLAYLRRAWGDHREPPLQRADVLDIGCGGGLFAEALAGVAGQVTGLDPSRGSIEAARRHAAARGLELRYVVGAGERLPFDDGAFDLVCCCDVLEHVDDVDAVLAESARVLRPGGVLLYDTINRTWLSKWIAIRMLQEWEWLRVAPPDLHSWERFITPAELDQALRRHDLEPRGSTGLAPDMNPLLSLRRVFAIRRLKRGELTHADLGELMEFHLSRSRWLNYMGYATKGA